MSTGLTILVMPGQTCTIVGTPAPTLRWHVGPVVQKQGVPIMPNEYTLTREQQIRFFIAPETPGGNPAPIDGAAQWTIDGGLCTLTPIDNSSTWVVSPNTGIGDCVLTVKADADMGEGIVTLMDTALIHVIDPLASNLGMGADEPVLKQPAP